MTKDERASDRARSTGRVIAATAGLSIASASGLWWGDGWLAGTLIEWRFRHPSGGGATKVAFPPLKRRRRHSSA